MKILISCFFMIFSILNDISKLAVFAVLGKKIRTNTDQKKKFIQSQIRQTDISVRTHGNLKKRLDQEGYKEMGYFEPPYSKQSLVLQEINGFLNDHNYNHVEKLGILIKHVRESIDLTRSQLAEKAYLSIEVVMAMELGIYDEDEILLEWLDRIAEVLPINLEHMKKLIGFQDEEVDETTMSETHWAFYIQEVFPRAGEKALNDQLAAHNPHQVLIDQLSHYETDDEQVKITQRWLRERAKKNEYIGKTLIILALSTISDRTSEHVLDDRYPTPQATHNYQMHLSTPIDQYNLICQWVSYRPDTELLVQKIKLYRDAGVSVEEMLIDWSRRSLKIKSISSQHDFQATLRELLRKVEKYENDIPEIETIRDQLKYA